MDESKPFPTNDRHGRHSLWTPGLNLTAEQEVEEIYARYDGPLTDEMRERIERLRNPKKGSRLACESAWRSLKFWIARRRTAKRIEDRIERTAEIEKIDRWAYMALTNWQEARADEKRNRRAA